MEQRHCLRVEGLGAAFGEKIILSSVSLRVHEGAITALLGPAGTGKSTLMHMLAGSFEAHPRFRSWGSVEYDGAPLQGEHRPHLVQQDARLMMASVFEAIVEYARPRLRLSPLELRQWCVEHVIAMGFPELAEQLDAPTMGLSAVQQRAVAILREAACAPALLMVDEPTAGLEDYEAYLLIDLLRHVNAAGATILLTVHNQKHARMAARHMILLAGGHVQEAGGMEDFLAAPRSEAGVQFVHTGSCALPAPDADPATLAEGVAAPPPLPQEAMSATAPAPAPLAPNEAAAAQGPGPRGLVWLEPGRIAGTPLPGVVHDIDYDLAALRQCGVTTLITLTERDLPQDALQRHGLRNLHLPVRDREPPSMAQIQMLLKRMEVMLQKNEVLAVHCLAGLGRTGTVLAAWLVREGLTATEALRRVRLLDAGYVQSDDQEAFLQQYEDTILMKII
jgi:atypical dual specificity phosphatase